MEGAGRPVVRPASLVAVETGSAPPGRVPPTVDPVMAEIAPEVVDGESNQFILGLL